MRIGRIAVIGAGNGGCAMSGDLALANAACARGELVMGGALGDPPDTALLVFKADDKSVIEEFVRNDPYVKAGLILEWSVRPWHVVIGG